jgi:transcriptional regulator with XRE-family HTH domain
MNRNATEWEEFLGQQLKTLRLRQNLPQAELAKRARVSTVTVSRLETGKGSSLATLIKVLTVLRQESWLEQLAPQASVSPIQVHNLGKPRERASRPAASKTKANRNGV